MKKQSLTRNSIWMETLSRYSHTSVEHKEMSILRNSKVDKIGDVLRR